MCEIPTPGGNFSSHVSKINSGSSLNYSSLAKGLVELCSGFSLSASYGFRYAGT